MTGEIFGSAVRPQRDFAGMFEYDGETGYFYWLDLSQEEGKRIKAHIHITSNDPGFPKSGIRVSWNRSCDAVGLYIGGDLWAAFHLQGGKHGGNYKAGGGPAIPAEIAAGFSANRS